LKFKKELAQWDKEYADLKSLLSLGEAGALSFQREQWLWARTVISSRNMQVPSHIFNAVFQESSAVEEISLEVALDVILEEPTEAIDIAIEQFSEIKKLSKSQKKRGKQRAKKNAQLPKSGNLSVDDAEATIPIIVPLADLANHSDNPNVIWCLNTEQRYFEMKTLRHVEEGGEITINYGFQPSWKYLLHYGFLPLVNAKRPTGVYESELLLTSRILKLLPSNPDEQYSLDSDDLTITALRKELWEASWTSISDFNNARGKMCGTLQTSIILTSDPVTAQHRFKELLCLCRAGAISSSKDASILRGHVASLHKSSAWSCVSPRNELHALQLLSEVYDS
jgi:hypothetical protein